MTKYKFIFGVFFIHATHTFKLPFMKILGQWLGIRLAQVRENALNEGKTKREIKSVSSVKKENFA